MLNPQTIALAVESQDLRLAIDVWDIVLEDEKQLLEIKGWSFIEGQSAETS